MKKHNQDWLSEIDNNWTLFLDRDGVINKRRPNDYVKNRKEFRFLPNVIKAIRILTPMFKRIVIVTKTDHITKNLGNVDNIYYCPHLRDNQCT